MANRVIELFNDREKLVYFGKNARSNASDFKFEKVKKEWLKLLKGIE